MQSARLPDNEPDRLEKLKLYRILDTPPEDAFDRITRIVAETIGVPIALVSLVDSERQWFKSKHGLEADETPRDIAFCSHAILEDGVFIVEDALKDARFAGNPLVTSDPSIRFYAGAPLKTPDGLNLGTLCAIDREPRQLTDKQRQLLSDLSSIVVDEMELRVALRSAMNDVAEAVKQRALKDEFVSIVTHELRTPLTSIRGSLGLLDSGAIKGIPTEVNDIVALANRNVNTLLALINDLLDFQKFQSGQLDMDFGAVDAETLARDTCENLKGFAQEKEASIRVEVESEATVVGDAVRLAQVLTNLISNAIKFTPTGEEVLVKTGLHEDKLRFSVTDKGPGIPENFRGRIFEKFSQARGENKAKGTGLGLAISKAIVKAHRGSIGFETRIGEGTTFHMDLPLRQTVL
jgi:signal transduction histidine kinase